ncbi:N-acetyltransferase family protein [Aeromicrobium sp.]|uniref:GNAT family N-acetyltransferase n=1 Tax=Aeromicrobium sp. TaxID=1871063 RepID=UPI00351173B3
MATRSPIVMRDAVPEDAAELVALWAESAAVSDEEGAEAFSYQSLFREPSATEAESAIEQTLAKPGKRIIVALVDDEIVGATVCDLSTLTPITLTPILIVTDIQVSPRHRRRNVAATLLSAAATYGEENACEIVVAAIPLMAREPHRYQTKIGFTQVAAVRAIQASRLRSRLSSKATHSRDTGKLIAVRRTLRRRQDDRRSGRV